MSVSNDSVVQWLAAELAAAKADRNGMGLTAEDWIERAQAADDGRGEELPCQECGARNPLWWTSSGTWNLAVGGDPVREAGGILCPTCFHRKWLALTSTPAAGMSAEDIVDRWRAQGFKAGEAWAQSFQTLPERSVIIAEADRRYPDSETHYLANYNLSEGFIDGVLRYFNGVSHSKGAQDA